MRFRRIAVWILFFVCILSQNLFAEVIEYRCYLDDYKDNHVALAYNFPIEINTDLKDESEKTNEEINKSEKCFCVPSMNKEYCVRLKYIGELEVRTEVGIFGKKPESIEQVQIWLRDKNLKVAASHVDPARSSSFVSLMNEDNTSVYAYCREKSLDY